MRATIEPSARTTSASSRLSMVRPPERAMCPIPPPSVSPPTPVVPMMPQGTAPPASCVAASTSFQTQPPPTRTVRAAASTSMLLIPARSMTTPSSHDAQAAAVVAAAADRDQRVLRAGEADHRRHVGGRGAAGDQRRPPVDHRVVDRARLVVSGVVRSRQGAVEAAGKCRASLRGECCDRAHVTSDGLYRLCRWRPTVSKVVRDRMTGIDPLRAHPFAGYDDQS